MNYRSATYNDSKYTDISKNQGFINGLQTLDNIAGSLRGEYDSQGAVKLIAAARYDKYNYPSDGYLSYQFAGNFKINERNLVRAVFSRSFRGPTMYDIYNSQSIYVLDQAVGPFTFPVYTDTKGNKNLSQQKVDMVELGYRLKATDYLHFDLKAFYQSSEIYALSLSTPNVIEGSPIPTKATTAQRISNIKLRAEQTGFTLSLNFLYGKLQFKPSATFQQTFLFDVSSTRDSATANELTYADKSNSSSPAWYGGAYLNYLIHPKLNFNVSAYYYGNYAYTSIHSSIGLNMSAGYVNISDKYLINAKVAYKVIDNLDVFISARNLFGAQAEEFSNTDITKGLYSIGANFEF